MGRRLERWRWRQLELLTHPSGHLRASADAGEVCLVRAFEVSGQLPSLGRGRTPAKKAGYAFDITGQLGWRPSRPLGNVQRRVLTLPSPRKRSAACFGAFRGLGNVQRRVLELSEPSETFSGAFWSFPRPRKRSAARFDTFRGLGASTDAGEVCLVRAFEVPGQLPSLGRGRTPAKFAWYGLLRYPASFPASAEAGGVRDASQESRVHDARTGVGAYRIRPHRRPAGPNLYDV